MTRLITRRPTRQVCRQHGREGKTQQRLGILGAILWVAGLFATSTCANTCPEKTIVVTVVLADDSVVGDEILVEVFRDQTLLKRGIIKRGDGHRGRIEIFLGEDYQVGMSLDLKVTSRLETVPIGSGTASVTLANSCSSVDVLVTKTPTEDWSCLGMLDLSVEPDARALPASKILKVHDLADRPPRDGQCVPIERVTRSGNAVHLIRHQPDQRQRQRGPLPLRARPHQGKQAVQCHQRSA